MKLLEEVLDVSKPVLLASFRWRRESSPWRALQGIRGLRGRGTMISAPLPRRPDTFGLDDDGDGVGCEMEER